MLPLPPSTYLNIAMSLIIPSSFHFSESTHLLLSPCYLCTILATAIWVARVPDSFHIKLQMFCRCVQPFPVDSLQPLSQGQPDGRSHIGRSNNVQKNIFFRK